MDKIEIYVLSTIEISENYVKDINGLFTLLTGKPANHSLEEISSIVEQPNLFVLAAFDTYYDKLVGMASLKVVDTRMFTQNYESGFIGDVVVDENYRGLGIAKKLMETLIDMAKGLELVHLSLTSNPNNPKRTAAIKLYEKLGFKLIGQINNSNYYRLEL